MNIIQVGKVLCSIDIFNEMFCCNYRACRGICCVEGDAGAPITMDEVAAIEDILPLIEGDLSPEARQVIEEQGIAYIDKQGDLVTSIVNGKDCVFTTYDDHGNCLCAIERAMNQGKHSVRKPISCSLYPVRVTRLTGGGLALNFHRWEICKPAFEKGAREGVRVYQFLKNPLTNAFGEDFYEALSAAATHLLRG